MAQSSGGRLIVVYVNETSRAALAADLANLEDEGQQAVHRAVEALKQDGSAAEFVPGDVWSAACSGDRGYRARRE